MAKILVLKPFSQGEAITMRQIEGFRLKLSLWLCLALILRWDCWNFQSLDFINFLNPWYTFIVTHGKFWALAFNFSNYNPPYLYCLVIWSYLFPHLPSLYAIKSISILFDFIGALLGYHLVKLKFPQDDRPKLAFLAILLTPTVILNSAAWGQCDMTYMVGLLGFLYGVSTGRFGWALVAFTIALSFKLQAIFLAPLLALLVWQGVIAWQLLAIVPVTYSLTLIPATLAGRPVGDLLKIYPEQAQAYPFLTLNAPNLYQWIPNDYYAFAAPLGVIFTAAITLFLLFILAQYPKTRDPGVLLHWALLLSLLIPFYLPAMHDRYLFPADVISVIFGFYYPQWVWVPLATVTISLCSYTPYLLGYAVIPLPMVSIGWAITIWQVTRLLRQTSGCVVGRS